MPRGLTTEARQRELWARNDMEIRMDIGAWLAMTNKNVGDLGPLIGVSRATMYNKYREPGKLSLEELRKLYQVIEKARQYREQLSAAL